MLDRHGIKVTHPPETIINEVDRIIFDELVPGRFLPTSRARFSAIIQQMANEGCDAVILGCTEIPLIIGEQVTVGHMALLHGCTIGDDTLIGMGAMVMNGAKVGKGCVIGANALVTEGKEIPDGSMVLGAPGKIVKTLDAETQKMLMRGAEAYKKRRKQYRKGLQQL